MPKRLVVALATALSAATAAATLVAIRPATADAATGGYDFAHPQVVTTGLRAPWGMAFLPDGSALVSQRDTADIMRVRPGSAPVKVATVPNVSPGGEGGLLGIAVSPIYALDQWIYAYYTSASDNRVVRFRLSSPQTQQPILTGIPRAQTHNGGRIAFGPDGRLYVGTGDAGNSANAQNLNSLGGKILRIRPDGTVPVDNPFAGSPVYSYGHRNVQGLAWDEGGRLYATEFGQNTWDELNRILPGRDYGWPICEGVCSDPRFTDPLVTWSPAEASPSGLAYAKGTLFAAALRGTRLWTVPISGGTAGTPVAEFQGTYGRLRTVAVGPDCSLWVATSNRDGRGTPAADDDRIIRVPPAAR
ncbi:PQQ-dependent sugar dehydrogenase [Microbispora catharanthi]|uniref:PQQ-dependent sugar dehydrogenase n=1 Tax=Microbispora catharanthi TaxID=1712871 RepID=A0A5N6BW47_9ACTN|nr:PQQ-dependent sugar dehydrogenase [Microbispora catharanthi]KAB8184661.1 PQQ-dependent sugar dehydrogenase [Microbispora catharanthi]